MAFFGSANVFFKTNSWKTCFIFSGMDADWGPLHTRAKSCGHEIVRAQKKVSQDRSKTPPKSCSVVTDFQV